MKKLRELKEFVAVEGKDRLDSELEGLSRDVLRQVSQAADLPVKVRWTDTDGIRIATCFVGGVDSIRGARGGGLG